MKKSALIQILFLLIFALHANLLLAQSKLLIDSVITGKWFGNAFQTNTKTSWDIDLSCDFKFQRFRVNYPTLGCSGAWTLLRKSDSSMVFTEFIIEGKRFCVDSGTIFLSLIDDKTSKFQALDVAPSKEVLAETRLTKC